MSGWYENYYWRTGFKSRLYDLLTPESYFESMRQTVALLPDKAGLKIWDAGCGSGMLLKFLKDALKSEMNYYGTDLLSAGLEQVKIRAHELGILDHVACFQNDLTAARPFKENSLDIVVAHFSIYTLHDNTKRQQALKNMYEVLKSGGILLASCPSKNYDANKIIKESLQLVQAKRGFLNSMVKRLMIYPFTKWLGLKFIQNQLESNRWIAYTLGELKEELQQAGFKIGSSEAVYADGAYLICGHKMH